MVRIEKIQYKTRKAIKKDIISCRRADLEPDCEIMVDDLQAGNANKTAPVLCYRPPSFDNEFFVPPSIILYTLLITKVITCVF